MKPSADLIWRAGAEARHKARVASTKEAALAMAGGETPLAIILTAIDLHGVGGRLGVSGGATRRLLRGSLGSGRWNASDGAAYRAAAEEALRELVTDQVEERWDGRVTVSFPNAKTIALECAMDFAFIPVADVCAVDGGEEFLCSTVGDKLIHPDKTGLYTPIGVVGPIVAWADNPGMLAEAFDWLAIPEGVPLDLGSGVEWDPTRGITLPVSPWRARISIWLFLCRSHSPREPLEGTRERGNYN